VQGKHHTVQTVWELAHDAPGRAQEFDGAGEEGLPAVERLARQRRGLNKRLGLGGPMDALLDTADLVHDEDLVGSGLGRGASVRVRGPSGSGGCGGAGAARGMPALKREGEARGEAPMQAGAATEAADGAGACCRQTRSVWLHQGRRKESKP